MTESKPDFVPQPNRYLEVTGKPVGAGIIHRLINRWSVCMALAAGGAADLAANPNSHKSDLAKQLCVGLVFAAASRFTTGSLAANYLGRENVIDINPLSGRTIDMRAQQMRAATYIKGAMGMTPTFAYISTVITFPAVTLLPAAADIAQTKYLFSKIAKGDWVVVPRSAMQPDRSAGNTPASP